MPDPTTTPSILDVAGVATNAPADGGLAAVLGAILGELKSLKAASPAASPAAQPTLQAPPQYAPAPQYGYVPPQYGYVPPQYAAPVVAVPVAPAPLHPLFGRRCRFQGGLAFVTKVYSEAELTVPHPPWRLADPANGDMVDLLAFDANGVGRPVKSVHIADADWAEE